MQILEISLGILEFPEILKILEIQIIKDFLGIPGILEILEFMVINLKIFEMYAVQGDPKN